MTRILVMLCGIVVAVFIAGGWARGMVVHHRNHDSTDDRPSNLEALTRQEHINRHRQDLRR
jgi:hypothetical protein